MQCDAARVDVDHQVPEWVLGYTDRFSEIHPLHQGSWKQTDRLALWLASLGSL